MALSSVLHDPVSPGLRGGTDCSLKSRAFGDFANSGPIADAEGYSIKIQSRKCLCSSHTRRLSWLSHERIRSAYYQLRYGGAYTRRYYSHFSSTGVMTASSVQGITSATSIKLPTTVAMNVGRPESCDDHGNTATPGSCGRSGAR